MDFGKVAKVTKIGTQGRHNAGQWVTKYIVSYSIDGGYFEFQMHQPYKFPRVSMLKSSLYHAKNYVILRQFEWHFFAFRIRE